MENSKKSLHEYYEQLKGIDEDWQRSEFFPAVSDDEIIRFEKEHNIQIPESYKDWLHLSNGGFLFGGDISLYGVYNSFLSPIGRDFTGGDVPNNYLIIGYMASKHICYDKESEKFFFYEYSWHSVNFDDFNEILDYIIDVNIN